MSVLPVPEDRTEDRSFEGLRDERSKQPFALHPGRLAYRDSKSWFATRNGWSSSSDECSGQQETIGQTSRP